MNSWRISWILNGTRRGWISGTNSGRASRRSGEGGFNMNLNQDDFIILDLYPLDISLLDAVPGHGNFAIDVAANINLLHII